jgi:hypothetical protein
MTAKKRESLREKYIAKIMKEKYGDDDPKYYDQNYAFLEGLSLNELSNLADGEFDEFELEGEVKEQPEDLNEY